MMIDMYCFCYGHVSCVVAMEPRLHLSFGRFKVDESERIRRILCDADSIQALIKPCIFEIIIGTIERLNHAFTMNISTFSSEIRSFGCESVGVARVRVRYIPWIFMDRAFEGQTESTAKI
jgi:hypothetical protein